MISKFKDKSGILLPNSTDHIKGEFLESTLILTQMDLLKNNCLILVFNVEILIENRYGHLPTKTDLSQILTGIRKYLSNTSFNGKRKDSIDPSPKIIIMEKATNTMFL